MKKIVYLVLLCMLERIKFCPAFALQYKRKLEDILGMVLAINAFRINGLKQITFTGITIKSKSAIIEVKEVQFNFHWLSLIRLEKIVDVTTGGVVVRTSIVSEETTSAKGGMDSLDKQQLFFFLERKLLPVIDRILNFSCASVKKVIIENVDLAVYSSRLQLIKVKADSRNFSTHIVLNIHDKLLSFFIECAFLGDQVIRKTEFTIKTGCNSLVAWSVLTGHIKYQQSIAKRSFDLEMNIIGLLYSCRNVDIHHISGMLEYEKLTDKFEITNASSLRIDDHEFSCNVISHRADPNIVQFNLYADIIVDSLLKSFPFASRIDMQKGTISGDLFLQIQIIIDLANLSQFFFEINVLENNVKVSKPDPWQLDFLNHSFGYERVGSQGPIRVYVSTQEKFMASSPNSELISKLIVFCEDPNFVKHQGVDDFYLGQALIVNLMSRSMKRGGSTITMQLVRNIFLHHKKTLTRKAEEIIIALYIENVLDISKERILEIYFSIIEFAPGVYGIANGTKLYFNKTIVELSFTEILILTYIIPRPFHFYNAWLEGSEQLNKNLKVYCGNLIEQLRKEGIISNTIYQQNDKWLLELNRFTTKGTGHYNQYLL